MMSVFNAMGIQEGEQIEHKMLSKAIETAQSKIESNNYGTRKNLLDYDQVMNEQREIIYGERLRVLNGESMRDFIINMINTIVEDSVNACISDEQTPDEWDMEELNKRLLAVIPLPEIVLTDEQKKSYKKKQLIHNLKEQAVKLYEEKEASFDNIEQFREIERVILLKVIDSKWMDHIDDMEQLRQGIRLQGYGQKDPVVQYKLAGYDMFDEMSANIQIETVRALYRVKIEQKVEREQVAKVTGTNKDESAVKAPKKRDAKKVYPNDPCPCGSGLKYKQCHGKTVV
jgi:preprotein translocase subunit SecA